MGTPAAWTTNLAGEPAYYSLNVWGPHHWVVLVDMDCSQTDGGWFEFGAVYSLGGSCLAKLITQTLLNAIPCSLLYYQHQVVRRGRLL